MPQATNTSRFFFKLNTTDNTKYQALIVPNQLTTLLNTVENDLTTRGLAKREELFDQVTIAKSSLAKTKLHSTESYVHELLAKEMLIRIIYDRSGVSDEEIDQLADILFQYDLFVGKENGVRSTNETIDGFAWKVGMCTGVILTAGALAGLFLINPVATLEFINALCNMTMANGAAYPIIFVLSGLIGGVGMLLSAPVIKLLGVLGCMEQRREIEVHAPAPCYAGANHLEFIEALREIKKPQYDELCPDVKLPDHLLESIKNDSIRRLSELKTALSDEREQAFSSRS